MLAHGNFGDSQVVDLNCAVSVSVDGVVVQEKKEVLLRVCDPSMEHCVLVKRIPAGARDVQATVFVGDASKTFRFVVPITTEPINERCAVQAVAHFHAEVCKKVLEALTARNYDTAVALNQQAVQSLATMFAARTAKLTEYLAEVSTELEEQALDIARSREDHAVAMEASMRTMSRSATVLNQGASIDPSSRTLSDLQSQLSSDY